MPESIKSSCSIQHFQARADYAHVTSASLSQPNLNLAQAFLSLASAEERTARLPALYAIITLTLFYSFLQETWEARLRQAHWGQK